MNPQTGGGQVSRLVSVVGIPRDARAMDDEVEVLFYLPAGSDVGPQVQDRSGVTRKPLSPARFSHKPTLALPPAPDGPNNNQEAR